MESEKDSEKGAAPAATLQLSMQDLLTQLDEYQPTIPDAVALSFMTSAGLETTDPKVVRYVRQSTHYYSRGSILDPQSSNLESRISNLEFNAALLDVHRKDINIGYVPLDTLSTWFSEATAFTVTDEVAS